MASNNLTHFYVFYCFRSPLLAFESNLQSRRYSQNPPVTYVLSNRLWRPENESFRKTTGIIFIWKTLYCLFFTSTVYYEVHFILVSVFSFLVLEIHLLYTIFCRILNFQHNRGKACISLACVGMACLGTGFTGVACLTYMNVGCLSLHLAWPTGYQGLVSRYRTLFPYLPAPRPTFLRHTKRSRIQKLGLFWGSQKQKRKNDQNLGKK